MLKPYETRFHMV